MLPKCLLALVAGPFLLSATEPRDPRTINAGDPPAKYHGDNSAAAHFLNRDALQIKCGNDAPKGYAYAGCSGDIAGVPTIVLPNPCAYRHEKFAQIACHELGHRNGWNKTHDN